MTLKVVEPINVTEAVLTASDIPEPDISQGEVEFVPNRRMVDVYDKNPSQPNSSFRSAAYVSGYGYYVLTNNDIEHYDENFNFVASRGVDSPLGSRERIFSSYDPETGISSGVYVLYRDSGNLVYTLASYEYDLSSYTSTVAIEPNAGDLSNKEFGGSIAGGPDTFTFAIRDQNPSPSSMPMTFYEFKYKYDASGPVKEVLGQQSVWDFIYRYDMVYTDKGVALMGFSDPNQDFITDIFFLNSDYTVNERVSLDPKTEFRSNIFLWNGLSYQMWCTSAGFGAPVGDFVVESYDANGVTRGAYLAGERAIKTDTHKVYQCLTATTEDPEQGATEDSTATWIVVGPTNKWAMFDDQNSTTTKSSGPFSVELESSDYIMAYGVTGSSGLTSVRCQVYDSGSNLIYDDTQSAFDNVGAPGDFIYASEDVFYKKKLYQTDIPPTENFKAVFTFNGSDIEIGNLTVGPAIELGPCLSDSKNESLDLSEQVFDDFGNETYTERPIITFATYETISSIESSNIINRFLNVIRRKGCLWIGEVGYNQSIVTFGRIERDPIPYTMPTEIRYTIRVRGFA